MRNGEAVVQKNAFAHVWMNVDEIEGHDMSNDDWLDSTVSGVQASVVTCASTIGHEFAHAMVLLTLGGHVEEPHFNGEALTDDNETGYSWENFVFGGSLQINEGNLCMIPSPNFNNGWNFNADDEDFLVLIGPGEGAPPPTPYRCVDKQKWQRLLEQSFWDQTDRKAFKKLWLRGGGVEYADAYLSEGGEVSASPSEKRVCLDEVERERQRVHALRKKVLQACKSEERRAVFQESRGKCFLDHAWSNCTKHYDENVFLEKTTSGAHQ
jgi:hypothetical protein